MKKVTIIMALAVCLMGAAYAGFKGTGYGKKHSVTSTGTRTALSDSGYVYELSVYNSGSADVYVAINSTLTSFTNAVATSNGAYVIIPSNTFYTFEGGKSESIMLKISNYCLQAESGTNDVYVSGF